MAVLYRLESFEGPLDLLLHLIEQAEVDIYDIPIRMITDQYMDYVSTIQQLELDIASDFLVMAATLLSIKSRMLLPKPPIVELDGQDDEDPDFDPREELVQKLIEYRKYKGIAEHLREKELDRSLIFSREPLDLTPYETDHANPLDGVHLVDLVIAFQKVLLKVNNRAKVATIRRDEISVKDRMVEMVDLLREQGGKLLFSKLFNDTTGKEEVVVTFLAILELMRLKQVCCHQSQLFEDIVIVSKEETADLELSGNEINY